MANEVQSKNYAPFLATVLQGFKTGEAFIHLFHGQATSDYIKPKGTVSRYLQDSFSSSYDVVAVYSLSGGIRFAKHNQRAKYFAIMGATDETPDADNIMMGAEPAVADLLTLIRKAPPRKAAVIIERLDDICGNEVPVDPTLLSLMEMIHEAGTDNELCGKGNPLMMLAPSLAEIRRKLYADNSGIKLTAINKPNVAERKRFAEALLAMESPAVTLDGITIDGFAAKTAGLLRRHIESLVVAARVNNHRLTAEMVTTAQREAMDIEFAHVVKRVDKPFRLKDVGGHVEFKQFAQRRMIGALKSGDYLGAPQNVLLVGPPGTGKTMSAAAVANETGLNCLEVDLSMLLSKYVGGTEGNIAELRRAILENAPCIVIMDEIDQKIRRGDGGSDPGGGGAVENRLFSSILEIFGDPVMAEAGVIGMFMSNLPKTLDAAFLSRMSAVIPLLPPSNDAERAGVLGALVRRFGGTLADDEPWLIELAGRVINWSGRDLEQVVKESLQTAKLDGMSLQEALSETITYRRADTQNVVEQVKQALDVCKDSRLVPAAYREALAKAHKPKAWNDVPGKHERTTTDIDLDAGSL